jgi:hypothetical protein
MLYLFAVQQWQVDSKNADEAIRNILSSSRTLFEA